MMMVCSPEEDVTRLGVIGEVCNGGVTHDLELDVQP
jgi:hypothetical protein